VPFMPGWILQWYENEPAVAKVDSNVVPGFRLPLPATDASSNVTVCAVSSPLVQATLSPILTVTVGGLKAKFLIETSWRPPPAAEGAAEGGAADGGAADGTATDGAAADAAGAALGTAVGVVGVVGVPPEQAATPTSAATARNMSERRTSCPPDGEPVRPSGGDHRCCRGSIRQARGSRFPGAHGEARTWHAATSVVPDYRSAMTANGRAPRERRSVTSTPASPDAIRALELHEARAHALGTRTVDDLGDAIFLRDAAERDPFLNRMSGLRLPSNRRACDRRLAELYVLFSSLDRRPHVWSSPRFQSPPDLTQRLESDGFVDLGGTYAMALASKTVPPAPVPAGARVERLSTGGKRHETVADRAARVMVDAFGAEMDTEEHLAADLAQTIAGRWDVCVVSVDDEPVAAGRRYTADGMTYLSSIGTRPAWRGRGFGAAVTSILAADGRRAGGSIVHLSVEAQDLRAQRLYERLGFAFVGDRIADLLLA
jgi:GNAT superfamily N-acetyltransferase